MKLWIQVPLCIVALTVVAIFAEEWLRFAPGYCHIIAFGSKPAPHNKFYLFVSAYFGTRPNVSALAPRVDYATQHVANGDAVSAQFVHDYMQKHAPNTTHDCYVSSSTFLFPPEFHVVERTSIVVILVTLSLFVYQCMCCIVYAGKRGRVKRCVDSRAVEMV